MSIDEVRSLGYTVGVAHSDPDAQTVYVIEGYGIRIYVQEGDTETMAGLVDEAAHKTRKFQFDNPGTVSDVEQLAAHGISAEWDGENGKVLVTKPGDAQPTPYTPAQVRTYLSGLPSDRYAALRTQIQAATTAPEIKAALKAVLEMIAPPPA